MVGTSIGFYLPLSVVPRFAQESGSTAVAGLPTVALLLATVAGELVTPRLIDRIGYRWSMAAGLALLGGPTLVLTVSDHIWAIVAVSLVRGVGFAVSVVAGGAVTALLIPARRRGEGLALVGIVSGASGMLALPGGVWAAQRWGCEPVFAMTAVVALLALLSVPGLPRRDATTGPGGRIGVLTGLLSAELMRPASIFAMASAATGVLVTFLPLATAGLPVWVVAVALLTHRATATAARWVAGRLGDRSGQGRLLAPGLLLAGAGVAAMSATGAPAAVIGGSFVFGAGFGVLQNATLSLMYSRAPVGGEGSVSAIWNAAYDLGMAAGALGAGLSITPLGHPATFLLTAAAILPALLLVRRDRRASPGGPERR
ncbi:MFS transporter [Glycomyces tenuis]|uniref:MFS transporter n=1 Tax=Glycomyces tenuis TaxID=58116 RepID=UPI0031F63673